MDDSISGSSIGCKRRMGDTAAAVQIEGQLSYSVCAEKEHLQSAAMDKCGDLDASDSSHSLKKVKSTDNVPQEAATWDPEADGEKGADKNTGLSPNHGIQEDSEADNPNLAGIFSGFPSSIGDKQLMGVEEGMATEQFLHLEKGFLNSNDNPNLVGSFSGSSSATEEKQLMGVKEGLVSEQLLHQEKEFLKSNERIPTLQSGDGVVIPISKFSVSSNGTRSRLEDLQQKLTQSIEVIDETALIQSPSVSRNGKQKMVLEVAAPPADQFLESGVHKKIGFEDLNVKKEKKSRKRGKGAKKVLEANGKHQYEIHYYKSEPPCGGGCISKQMYSRKLMETLRYVDREGQRRMWNEIYCALSPAVAREYDGLVNCAQQKPTHLTSYSRQQRFPKTEGPSEILGGSLAHSVIDVESIKENKLENLNGLESCGHGIVCEGGDVDVEGECMEDSDSDEEYSSILRPAFMVDGDPDFDSGPPEDGWEYLRRVRWEAAQIPKVKVAKLDKSNFHKEQTVYMPMISDIAKCPDDLLPSKSWEDVFLADFSQLRLALSDLQGFDTKDHSQFESVFRFHDSRVLPDDTLCESVDSPSQEGAPAEYLGCSPAVLSDDDISPMPEQLASKSPIGENSIDKPMLSEILGMDSRARVSVLRRRISSFDSTITLSRNDCLWLFALCATIDTPLDADTSAAIRSLLRKCASLRAAKTEPDDDLAVLNILATISGKYFGQLEK